MIAGGYPKRPPAAMPRYRRYTVRVSAVKRAVFRPKFRKNIITIRVRQKFRPRVSRIIFNEKKY